MSSVSDRNVSVLDEDERAVLLAALLDVDGQRLDVQRRPETDDRRPSRVRCAGTARGRDVERALEDVDQIVCVTYDRASKTTHLGPAGRTEIATLVKYVHGVLRDLLLG